MAQSGTEADIQRLLKTITELENINKLQQEAISQYEDDFRHEREDRIRAVQENSDLKKEKLEMMERLQSKHEKSEKSAMIERLKKEIVDLKSEVSRYVDLLNRKQIELETVKSHLDNIEEVMQKQSKFLNGQLNEAREEIAVKTAQLKQYQKQVEAYKQQLAEARQPNCRHDTPPYPLECTDQRPRGPACDNGNRLNQQPQASTTPVLNGVNKEPVVNDDLPPPIFYTPMQHPQVYGPLSLNHPAVAEGRGPALLKHSAVAEGYGLASLKHPAVVEGYGPALLKHSAVAEGYGPALPRHPAVAGGYGPLSLKHSAARSEMAQASRPSDLYSSQTFDLSAGIDDEISRMATDVQKQTDPSSGKYASSNYF